MNVRALFPALCLGLMAFGVSATTALADVIYVTTTNAIVRVGANGSQSAFLATGISGPSGIVFDAAGDLYVSEPAGGTVKRYPAGGGAPVTMASGLNSPTGLAISPSGVLHAAISGDNKIVKITAPDTVANFASLANGASPQGIIFDADGKLYVANRDANTISEVAANGNVTEFSDDVIGPVSVALDSGGKPIALHGGAGGEIVGFNPNGKKRSIVGSLGTPLGLAVDAIGNMFVATTGDLVKQVTPAKDVTTLVSSIATSGQIVTRAPQYQLIGTTGEVLANPEDTKFKSFGSPIIANGGRVAHLAKLEAGVGGVVSATDTGIWAVDGAGVRRLVAREGGAAPGVTDAAFQGLSDPVLNANGRVAFRGALAKNVGDATPGRLVGLWAETGSGLGLVVRQGDQPPGLSTGAKFLAFQQYVLPDAGGLVFLATVAGTDVTAKTNAGVWAVDGGGQLQLVARKGDSVATAGGTKVVQSFALFTLVPNSSGQTRSFSSEGDLCFRATFTDGTSAILTKPFGSSTLSVATFKNQTLSIAPIGAKLTKPLTGSVNSDEVVAFRSNLSGGGVTSANNQAIYLSTAGVLSEVSRKGFIAPDTTGAVFASFSDPALNDLGEVAFRGKLKSGQGDGVAGRLLGLWYGLPDALNVIRQGDSAPGVSGNAKFASFDQFATSAGGGVLFLGKVAGGGITSANNIGAWQIDAAGALGLLARKGDEFLVNGNKRKVAAIQILKAVPLAGAQGRHIAGDGAVTLLLKFTDASQAVYRVTVP